MINKEKIGKLKDKILFFIIKLLFRYIKRKYIFESIDCFYTNDGISGSGVKHFILGKEPTAIVDCIFVKKNNNIGFIVSLFNKGYITKEQYIQLHGIYKNNLLLKNK